MDWDTRGVTVTRRELLGAVGASSLAGLAGCGGDGRATTPTSSTEYANQPVDDNQVTIGLTIPQSGPFSPVGTGQQRGFELAIDHLNEGGGWVDTDAWQALSGGGILGRTVESVIADTESSSETARDVAETLVEQDGAVMVAGGGSTNTARELLKYCPTRGVVHMLGFAPGTNVTGIGCSRYGFQEMHNSRMAANALVPVLTERSEGRTEFYQLYASSDFGFTQSEQFRRRFQSENWSEMSKTKTRVGTENFRPQLREAVDADVDAIVLSYRGRDAVTALNQAKDIVPEEMGIVMPIVSRQLARDAGADMAGVVGTISWDYSIDTPLSTAFTESFNAAYAAAEARVPSDQARLAYAQMLQYAAAVERAGTFEPPAVIREIEDTTYQAGRGEATLRACDHQSMGPVPVVEGSSQGPEVLDVIEISTDVGYGCEEYPASECTDLGPYEPETADS
ncbi:substrate-binding protein [Haloarcula sp. NS06]|uniref:substrate-binding protein n=1 Tax=unclassified Haloarcula TaxID=2624677 RepID=UPI0027B81BC9|nr:substrate-binding protein [Haloarcula sp. H-GB4]MDQ2073781.1 substrate-binding protein [Haloarcula sp. H-GB4]